MKVLLKLKKGGEPVESDLCKCSEFGGINYVFCDEEVEIVQKSPQFNGWGNKDWQGIRVVFVMTHEAP